MVVARMVTRTKDVDPTENGFRLYEYLNSEAIDALHEHARWRDDGPRVIVSEGVSVDSLQTAE